MQFNDPTRDWATDMDERVHTLAFSVDVPHLTDPHVSATTGYDVVGSRARYMYLLEADTTLAPVPQLPPVRNVVHAATVDVRRTFTRQLALAVSYRTEPEARRKGATPPQQGNRGVSASATTGSISSPSLARLWPEPATLVGLPDRRPDILMQFVRDLRYVKAEAACDSVQGATAAR